MNIKYIDVQFKEGLRDAYVGNITQWDYGQVLKIQGIELPAVTTVYFSMQQTGGKSIPKLAITSTDGCTYVSVPKQILEQPVSQNYKAYAFVYPSTPEEGRTVGRITMSIKSIPKPDDLNSPEDAALFQEVLEQLNVTLQESKDLAKLAESYAKGGTGTRENEDTDNSKFYAELAQDYVQNIGIDRDAVEQIKLEVEQLKQAIDLSEQNVRKDMEQVTQDKQDITLIAEDVRQNKEAVDLTKQSVEQSQADVTSKAEQVTKDAQQTSKDVQQTAKDKKVVEDVKTQFVQDVKDATESIKQQTSTSLDAINTKTEEQLQAVTDKGTEQVKAVEQAGAQFTQELPKLKQDINSKLDRNLGTENKDKVLKVDTDGNVVPVPKAEIVPDNLQEDILKNAVKPTVKGNPIVLKDSADAKAVELEVSGSTNQVQTSGKNLIDISKIDKKENEVIYLKDGFSLSGKKGYNNTSIDFLAPPDNYTFRCKIKQISSTHSMQIDARKYQSTQPTYAVAKSNKTEDILTFNFKIPENEIGARIYFYSNSSGIDEYSEILFTEIMLNKGTEPTPYEPYSGGQPSPSPEYPQEVKQGECDNVSYTGKNLFDDVLFFSLYGNSSFYGFKKGDLILKKADGRNWETSVDKFLYLKKGQQLVISSNDDFNAELVIDNNTKATSQKSTIKDRIFLIFDINADGWYKTKIYALEWKYPKTLRNFMFSYDISSYEPYKGSTKTFPKIELSKWDKIVKVNGVWKKENWSKLVSMSDMVDTKIISTDKPNTVYIQLAVDQSKVTMDETVESAFCTILPFCKTGASGKDTELFQLSAGKGKYIFIRINKNRFETINLEVIENWFRNSNFEIYCKAITPTYEILPQETQDALNSIETFYPNSIIQTNEGIELDLQYVADTKLYIDGKFAELKKELANTQNKLL